MSGSGSVSVCVCVPACSCSSDAATLGATQELPQAAAGATAAGEQGSLHGVSHGAGRATTRACAAIDLQSSWRRRGSKEPNWRMGGVDGCGWWGG